MDGHYVVAIVDDDPEVLHALENLLQSAGHTVRLFSSAEALLRGGGFAQLDCLISDLHMPAMDGLRLAQLAWRSRPDLPIILITGGPALTDDVFSARVNSHGLFPKPFDARALLAAVNDALSKIAAS